MKKITFIIFLTVLTFSAFSQQFLWSTTKDTAFNSMRYVQVDNVVSEVLKFYEQYQFYFDGSGYSKDGFFKIFENSQSLKNSNNVTWIKLKKKISAINDLTAFAFKDNLGHGSVITVMCVTKDNVDMLSFSNNYKTNWIPTLEKEKFTKWFRSFIPNQIITTDNTEENEMQDRYEDKIFTRVENEAAFPGGESAWRRYLEKKLNSNTPVDNGAPEGTYQVIVKFIVSKDGSVSDVQAETKHGYGMEAAAIKIIQDGPKWTPALQNGRNVTSYRRQPITFIVGQKN